MQELQPMRFQESLVSAGIDRWVFNRTETSFDTLLRTLAHALSPPMLIANGGFLFKAGLYGSEFHIGFIPTLREGERGYHHDIRLKHEDVFTLIGSITTQGELSIIFKNPAIHDSDMPVYERVYQKLAQLFLAASPDPTLTLDWITIHLLEHKRILPTIPQTLTELALSR